MANYTPNLNLEKPLQTEGYDVDIFNANADKIDTFAGQIPARALTADKLTTGAKINGVNFKGDTDITLPVATTSVAGTVKPDGETVLIDDGIISATIPQQMKHALKGYLDEGEALVDTELYNDVHGYANSTFDISKFTIIGTPKITDDGIASGLSTSNYINAIPSSMYYNKSNWHLQFKGKFDPTITCGFMDFDNDVYAYLAYMDGWHSITLQLYDTSDQQIFISIEYANDKFVKGDILFDIYYSSTSGYYFTATQNGTTYTSSTSSNTNQLKNASTQPLLYIHSSNTSSIDLKTIKFFVDNQPVFDGNISGVDTVFSDNYTVVGSPTITGNGVASGFSATSYLTYTMNFSGSGFKARIPFKVTSTNATQELFHNTNLQFRLLYVSASTAVYPSIYLTDGVHTTQPRTSTYKIVANTNYIVEYEFIQGTSVSIKLYAADGVTLLDSLTNTTADTKAVVLPNVDLTTYIGATNTGTNVFSGSIDLAGTRIETDTEVYRPFLQIPYVLSSTGSKIVDSAYRDRVIDLYEQEGKARYYTIDYVNKTATVPLGEVYGQIESEIVDNPDKVQSANLINIAKTDVVEPSVYEKLEKDYRSSFDLSKFTVVGSPVITDDGIASGFSSSNYLTCINISNFYQKSWSVSYGFIYKTLTSSNALFSLGSTINDGGVGVSSVNGVAFNGTFGESTQQQGGAIKFPTFLTRATVGNRYVATLSFNYTTGQYTLSYIGLDDGISDSGTYTPVTTDKQIRSIYTQQNLNVKLCGGLAWTGYDVITDLKQFSLTVDGYPVFNGNKTGIDTIKPDDYTVVGTPTITSDGIASGFSASPEADLKRNIDFSNINSFVIEGRYYNTTSSSLNQAVFELYDTVNNITKMRFGVQSNGTTSAFYYPNSDTTVTNNQNFKTITLNTWNDFKIVYDGTNVSIYINNMTTSVLSVVVTKSWYQHPMELWIGLGSNQQAWQGSIDLNSIRIYTNGNLIYQPCLKIPYTFAKDGKKIVDAIYQDRVIDVYQQYGSALYTIINEDKKTYNLPMGSMQGFIENRQVIGDWCTESPLPEYAYGVELVGSLTNNNGVLSNFSASNYATLPIDFVPASNTWEMNFKVTTGANVATNQEIISDKFGAYELAVYNSHFYLEINDTAYTGTYTVLTNTTYYVKIKFTGTSYIVSYSTNGSSFTNDITVNSSTPYSGEGTLFIGIDQNNVGEPWLGTIDLKGCNFSINNVIEWKGVGSPKVTATIDKPPVVVDVFEDGKNGYRTWSDGKIEQWGYKISTSTSATTYTVNFLKPFKNRNYKFFRSADWKALMGGNSSSYDNGYLSKTTSSITFAMHESSAQNGTDWYAFGY